MVASQAEVGPPAVETGDEPPSRRLVAPGGWRRALVAFGLGALAGALVALVAPREEGPRRSAPLTGDAGNGRGNAQGPSLARES